MRGFEFVSFALHVGSQGHQRAFLGVDPGDDQAQVVVDGFPIDGQRAGQFSGLTLQPARQTSGQPLPIDPVSHTPKHVRSGDAMEADRKSVV